MNEDLFGPITLANGVRWNSSVSADGDADLQAYAAVIDVLICLRGGTPNLHLGDVDKFVFSGEYELALREIENAIAAKTTIMTELNKIALARASSLVTKSNRSSLEGGYTQGLHVIRDLVIVLRAENPNLYLHDADTYLWAGEEELALDAIEDIITKQPALLSDRTQAIFTKALEEIRN